MVALAALALLLVAASTAGAAERRGSPRAADQQGLSPSDARGYWTRERMLAAEPADFPSADGAPFADLGSARAAKPEGPHREIRGRRGTLDGYSVNPDLETDPAGDTSYPQRIHGKIFGSLPGGDYSCSGTVIASPLKNLIVTAGHCVFGQGSFAQNFVFIPGYRNGNAPLGVWPANNLYAPNGWTQTESFTFDIGMATLDPVGGQSIETLLGSRGVAFNDNVVQTWDMFGYPARPNPTDDGFGDYDSERLIVCDNATTHVTENPNGDGDSIGAAYCFMQQGSSGGGWVTEGGSGPVESVVSHGYCQDDPLHTVWDPNTLTGKCGLFFGPYFGEAASNVYDAAIKKPTPPPPPPPPPPRSRRPRRCRRAAAGRRSAGGAGAPGEAPRRRRSATRGRSGRTSAARRARTGGRCSGRGRPT